VKSIHLSALVWIGFGIVAVSLALDGAKVTTGTFQPCGVVVTVLGLVLLTFDKWLWGFSFLHPWFVDRPYLKGTWKGVLESNYADPVTQQRAGPIEVYLVIRQTFSAIHLRLLTNESASESMANNIPKGEDGVYIVASVYRNTPRLGVRDRSTIHHGAVILSVEGNPVVSLRGEYWTDRLTRGEMQFLEKSDTLHFDFASAAAGTYARPGGAPVVATPVVGQSAANAPTQPQQQP
jgi:hypothetical protein